MNASQLTLIKEAKRILEDWDEAPQYFITSAEARQGKEEILSFIADANKLMVVE